jgi:hypothetical protein
MSKLLMIMTTGLALLVVSVIIDAETLERLSLRVSTSSPSQPYEETRQEKRDSDILQPTYHPVITVHGEHLQGSEKLNFNL